MRYNMQTIECNLCNTNYKLKGCNYNYKIKQGNYNYQLGKCKMQNNKNWNNSKDFKKTIP